MKIKSLIHRMALWPIALTMVAAVFLVVLTGCNTTSQNPKPGNFSVKDVALPAQSTNDVVLKEGDVVRVVFPNGDKMDSVETIRPDGKITLPIIGDVSVSGKTPTQMQKELADKYSKDIRSSDLISFVVQSSSFQVYVMGSVMRPGKVVADHVLTVLDSIMEAGGFDPDKAQLKSVKVVRTQAGRTQTFLINLQGVQKPGAPVEIFYLQPNDIVMVPQKLVLF
jgi:polysaccharide biosynthesis/export protein